MKAQRKLALTFVENAILKARYASEKSGLPAIADDSGLVVDALNGAPGLYSARYAGVDGEEADAKNREKLLGELANVPTERCRKNLGVRLCYYNTSVILLLSLLKVNVTGRLFMKEEKVKWLRLRLALFSPEKTVPCRIETVEKRKFLIVRRHCCFEIKINCLKCG